MLDFDDLFGTAENKANAFYLSFKKQCFFFAM